MLLRSWTRYIKKGSVNLFQSGAIVITESGRYYKVGQVYNKVKQVLQSETVLQQSGAGIAKWRNYHQEDEYLFVTLGRMETYAYLLTRPMRFEVGVVKYNVIASWELKPFYNYTYFC